MNKTIIYIMAFTWFFSSCKKDEADVNYPTIYPLPYFPVYPGSEWTYLDDHGDTIIYSTESNYVLHSYASSKFYGAETEPVYVPVWMGRPVYGYSFIEKDNSPNWWYYPSKILSEVPGDIVRYHYDNHGWYSWSTVTSPDTSVVVNNLYFENVIVIADSSGNNGGQNEYLRGYTYYAKDVGLIKIESVDSLVHQKLGIISYHINH